MNDASADGVSAFEHLHPAVQYHIVNSLGWPALRELQARSVAPILGGHHALLIAPTAGGKTEAAMLPVLSRMLSEEWRGLSVLYICPIKALLNDLEARLSHLAGLLGRTVQLWHGDIGQGAKTRAQRELPDILLTTPESLEGILIGARRDHLHLLGGVRCVMIDELHAFAGDDRGWHLLALLERIHALRGHEVQRIGLSATVGAPQALLDWLAGHCAGKRSLVRVEVSPAAVELCVDYVGSLANAATLISRLHRGEKRLVFCDSRSRVEELAIALRARGMEVFVSHAALSADTRRQAEQAFAERRDCVIVATRTLELGLDVGDLDRVIQIDAPGSVASFLQRLGRTGRRADNHRNLLFIATRDEGLLESLAIVQLFEAGFVEPIASPPMPCHLLVQQLFAMLFQHSLELEERVFTATLRRIPAFAELLNGHWDKLREHLIANGFLIRNGLMLTAGPRTERAFRGRGLAELCVSFDSPQLFSAFHGNRLLGHIDPLNLFARRGGQAVLALGGRSWRVVSIDRRRDRVYVEAAEEKGSSRWLGESRGVSGVIAEQVKSIIESPPPQDSGLLTKRASHRIAELCAAQEYTLSSTPIRLQDGDFEWWTYAGLAANTLLAARIAAAGGTYGALGSYGFRFQISDAAVTAHGGWDAIRKMKAELEPPDRDRIKFSEMVPDDLLAEMGLQRINAKSR